MEDNLDIIHFLNRHFNSNMENDLETYHGTTSEDLTLYEWFVTSYRINRLPFHDFMMESNASRGTVFGGESGKELESCSLPQITSMESTAYKVIKPILV